MSQSTKWVIGVIIAVIAVIYFVLKGPSEEASAGPIKIGFIGPLSGDAAVYGEPGRNIVQLAVEEINSKGGINGRSIEMVYENGNCNGKDGANAMQKLVNIDKVKVVIGGFCSSESLAAVPIAEQNKVFLLSNGSSSPDLTGISEYFARNYPSDATQGAVLANVVYKDKNARKVAFIQEQLDYPLGIYKAFNKTFRDLGGETIKEEFPSEETDFRSILTKLRAAKPDALFVDTQTPAVAERILQQLSDLGWTIQLLVSDAVTGDVETVRRNATILEGTLAAEFGIDPSNQKFQTLLSGYQKKYGSEVPFQSYAQTEYDSVYMLRDAISEVGYDAGKIARWFREVKNWEGASGLTTIGDDGDRDGGHVPKIVKGGKVELYSR